MDTKMISNFKAVIPWRSLCSEIVLISALWNGIVTGHT